MTPIEPHLDLTPNYQSILRIIGLVSKDFKLRTTVPGIERHGWHEQAGGESVRRNETSLVNRPRVSLFKPAQHVFCLVASASLQDALATTWN